jgi:hypothetical protein
MRPNAYMNCQYSGSKELGLRSGLIMGLFLIQLVVKMLTSQMYPDCIILNTLTSELHPNPFMVIRVLIFPSRWRRANDKLLLVCFVVPGFYYDLRQR